MFRHADRRHDIHECPVYRDTPPSGESLTTRRRVLGLIEGAGLSMDKRISMSVDAVNLRRGVA